MSSNRVCPVWIGYLLLNPLRRLFENPDRMFKGLVNEGMTVLEPGCGMGYFTLPLARLVGDSGKVIAVDIQEKMLSAVRARATKVGLSPRIETRLLNGGGLSLPDLEGKIDLTAAIHMVHETPDQGAFFRAVHGLLKTGGRFYVLEPKGHVSPENIKQMMDMAGKLGFVLESDLAVPSARGALFIKRGMCPAQG